MYLSMKINYNREVASEDAPVRSNNSGLGINVAAKKVSVKEEKVEDGINLSLDNGINESNEEVIEHNANPQNEEKQANGKKVYLSVSANNKLELAIFCRDFELTENRTPRLKDLRFQFPWLMSRQKLHKIKKKKSWGQRVIELQSLVEEKRHNDRGGGRKMSEIHRAVYPLLKEAMEKAARVGGDTTRKTQCTKYKQIARSLGFEDKKFPEEVLNGRMQRFDKYLNFTLRACNQKKSNREENYELDRLSRYIKHRIEKNVIYAQDLVKS